MSAEIIQFGKSERRVSAPTLRASETRALPTEKTSVRFIFDNELLEVDFYGDDVERVCAVQYRVSADGVKEMRRLRWGDYLSRARPVAGAQAVAMSMKRLFTRPPLVRCSNGVKS
jgi:hypothetical protein